MHLATPQTSFLVYQLKCFFNCSLTYITVIQ